LLASCSNSKQSCDCCLPHAGLSRGLLFKPEDKGYTFL
jgi:hypothetical protein